MDNNNNININIIIIKILNVLKNIVYKNKKQKIIYNNIYMYIK